MTVAGCAMIHLQHSIGIVSPKPPQSATEYVKWLQMIEVTTIYYSFQTSHVDIHFILINIYKYQIQ